MVIEINHDQSVAYVNYFYLRPKYLVFHCDWTKGPIINFICKSILTSFIYSCWR
jgi:hypothetical protein